ncbi:MAG: hypothetical protein GXP35_08490 [Actinobacteria bacterium]|nr:hypothetical protein [Actinomycetota bacterium]
MTSPVGLNRGHHRSTGFDVTATSLTALNGQLGRETDGLCSLLWQALYNGESMGSTVRDDVIESCLDSLSILAGTTGLEQMMAPVSELRLLFDGGDNPLVEFESCMTRVTVSAQWICPVDPVKDLDQEGPAPT